MQEGPRMRHAIFATSIALAIGCQGQITDGSGGGAVPPSGAAPGATPGAPAPPATPHPPVTTPAEQMRIDQMMQAANPDLFALATKYFPSQDVTSAPKRLSRLTRTQLDLTAKALMPTYAGAAAIATVPPDPLQTNYEYAANLSFNDANFTPYSKWVDGVAAAARAKPAVVVDCAASN